ncbi:NAD-dependent protein deacetylase%2C SIR2 family [Mycobacterium tuberculosis]|nr:NAD-dependent protein deacetylase%2C SIR2 family [Mycobacterium tuberculosis]
MTERIGVLTGAGISTDSGIPDYRGPSGVWTRDPELAALFTRKHFISDAGVRRRFWRTLDLHRDARPNAAHRALAELERTKAVRVLTQNVEGLHQKAGSTPRKVPELHGTGDRTVKSRVRRSTKRHPRESVSRRTHAWSVVVQQVRRCVPGSRASGPAPLAYGPARWRRPLGEDCRTRRWERGWTRRDVAAHRSEADGVPGAGRGSSGGRTR